MDNKSKSGFQAHQQNGAEAMLKMYGLGVEEEDPRFSATTPKRSNEPKTELTKPTKPANPSSAKLSHDEEGCKISAWIPMSLNLAVEGKIHNMAVNGIRTNKTNVVRDYLAAFAHGKDITCPSGHRFIVVEQNDSDREYTCPVCRKKVTA